MESTKKISSTYTITYIIRIPNYFIKIYIINIVNIDTHNFICSITEIYVLFVKLSYYSRLKLISLLLNIRILHGDYTK